MTDRAIPAEDGEDRLLVAGQNVRADVGEVQEQIYAEIDGRVEIEGDTVNVHPVMNIRGDVDYDVGNIDFAGDIDIGGTVRPGFSVKAGGGVTVKGHVEGGASVRAGGSIAIRGGVLGEDTRVVSGASVMAKFVQGGQIKAAAEVVVGSYVFNASVVARQVVVHGRGAVKGGALVGGVIWGTECIEAPSVGSALTANTTLVGGRDPEAEEKLKLTAKQLALCSGHLLEIVKAVGVPELTPESIRQALERAPPGRRDAIGGQLRKLKGLTEVKQKLILEQDRLRDAVEEAVNAAEIRVRRTAFSGTLIRIGDAETRLSEDVERATFKKVDDRIAW